jgi:hypothetical protein
MLFFSVDPSRNLMVGFYDILRGMLRLIVNILCFLHSRPPRPPHPSSFTVNAHVRNPTNVSRRALG